MSGNPFIATFEEHADYGVAYGRTFTYLDPDGVPIPTNGYTAVLKIRQDYSTDPVLTITGVTNVDGTVSFTATATQMRFPPAASALFRGVYDVLLLTAGSPALKLVRGSFTVHPSVSA